MPFHSFHPLAPGTRPAAYPADYERTITLRDRRRTFLRPVLREDSLLIDSTFGQAATAQRRTSLRPGDSSAVAFNSHDLGILDYETEFRVVAYDFDGRLVGTASYREIPDAPWDAATAAAGFCTHPEWRGIGLACEMLGAIALRACESGIEQLCARLAPTDVKTRHLVELVGGRIIGDDPECPLAVALTRRAVNLAAV